MGFTDVSRPAWPVRGYASLLDHVCDFVDALGFDQVGLIGHSQGSYVAAEYALARPEQTRGMVLLASGTICSAMGIAHTDAAGLADRLTYDGTLDGMRNFLASVGLGDRPDLAWMAERRHAADSRPGAGAARAAFEDARRAMEVDLEALARFSLRDRLPALRVPTQFLWGRDDVIAPYPMGQALAQLLPGIPFEFLDGCGHYAQYDRPDEVIRSAVELFGAS